MKISINLFTLEGNYRIKISKTFDTSQSGNDCNTL